VSYGDRQRPSFSISSPRAPWRRAARPLVVLFTLQLSGIGCAARAPELPAPTKPDDFSPYLTVYEEQLAQQGITLEGAEDYVAGRSASPLPEAADSGDGAVVDAGAPQGQVGEPTYKVIDGVPEYRIGAGDVVRVTSFLGPETPAPLSFRVQSDGTIFVARFNIGAIQAAGSTPSELTRVLTDAFRQYVPNGFVEVRIDEYNAWRATLTGEIVSAVGEGPGSYGLEGRVTASDFIYAHGGPTASADLGDVRVIRGGNELRVDVAAVLSGSEQDPALLSGDIVHVPSIEEGSSRFFIFGEVAQPGVYIYTSGISVLDAIAQAGGYTQTAKRSAVYISRPGTAEVVPVDLDVMLGAGLTAQAPPLVAGDFVVVPYAPDRSQLIRDWVGIFSLILSALTIIELVRRD